MSYDDQNQNQPGRDGAPPPKKPGNGNGPQAPPPMKFGRSLMSWTLILGLLIILFMVLNSQERGRPVESWQAFLREIQTVHDLEYQVVDQGGRRDSRPVLDALGQKVTETRTDKLEGPVTLKNDRIVAQLKRPPADGEKQPPPETIYHRIDSQSREWYIRQLDQSAVPFKTETGTSLWLQLFGPLIPVLLIIVLIWFFIARSMRSAPAAARAACSAASANRGTGCRRRTPSTCHVRRRGRR